MNAPAPARGPVEWMWDALPAVYFLFVLLAVLALYPGMRATVLRWLQMQVWAYQRGRWERDTPTWKREALEVRGRLPRQQPAAGV